MFLVSHLRKGISIKVKSSVYTRSLEFLMTNGLSYSRGSHSPLWPLPLTRRACFLPFTPSILVWSLASLLTKPFPGKAYASEQ